MAEPQQDDDVLQALGQLPLLKLLESGDFGQVSREMVEELFNILDYSQTGVITADDLTIVTKFTHIKLSQETILSIIKDCDKSGDQMLTVDELYRGIKNGDTGMQKFLGNIRGQQKSKSELQRSDFLKYLNYQFDKDDACWSLPFTSMLFVIFLFYISDHLYIESQFAVHSALEGELSGEGGRSNHEGPFLTRDVHDVPTWWDWATSSFCTASFKNDLDVFPQPGRLGAFNQMVGGLQLKRIKTNNEKCIQQEWLQGLYQTDIDLSCQPEPSNMDNFDTVWMLYHKSIEHLQQELRDLQDALWINGAVTLVEIKGLFLNAQKGLFTNMQLRFDFQRDGFIQIKYEWASIPSDPYRFASTYILDTLFVLMIFKMIYTESKELIPAIQNGWDGFMDYWSFWNIVDWLSILVALVQFGLWLSMVGALNGGFLDELTHLQPKFDSLDAAIREQRKFLTPAQLDSIVGGTSAYIRHLDVMQGHMESLFSLQQAFTITIGLYTSVMIFRFFKAFRANPRLSIVTDTISMGAVDLVHFFIVFIVFFLAFAVIASVFFGPRMKLFSTLGYSLMMCWRILMGEFDVDEMTISQPFIGYLWFILFEVLVLLVLLNMLLAIVMDTYSAVKGSQTQTQTIWDQAVDTYVSIQETKGFMNLWYLICELEDDDNPAHPEKKVTPKTLRNAFPKMSRKNAEYLWRKALEYITTLQSDEGIMLSDAVRLIARMEIKLKDIGQSIENMSSQMQTQSKMTMLAIQNMERPTEDVVTCRKCNNVLGRGDSLSESCPACGEMLEPLPEPPISSYSSVLREQFAQKPTSGAMGHAARTPTPVPALSRNTTSSTFFATAGNDRAAESLEKLVEFMKPEGLLDDRFLALEKKTEQLAHLCEEVLRNNLEQRQFLDRIEHLEQMIHQFRRENVANVKMAKDVEALKGQTKELARTVKDQGSAREQIMWQVALNMKDVKKDLGDLKQQMNTGRDSRKDAAEQSSTASSKRPHPPYHDRVAPASPRSRARSTDSV